MVTVRTTSASQLPLIPSFTGDLASDTVALSGFAARIDELVAAMPAAPERTEAEQAVADEAHRTARWLRARFCAAHIEPIHDLLTDGGAEHPRIDALADRAAAVLPGLVPTGGQLADELTRLQAHKDGREIDQAILFAALLRSPRAGTHLLESMLRPTPRALSLLGDFRRQGSLDLGSVLIERGAGIAHVEIRNGHALNSEDNQLVEDLETAVDLVLLDDETRVGVLRGAVMTHPRYAGRRVFSAGINLKHLHQGRISYVDFLLRRELGFIHKIKRGLLLDDTPRTWPHRGVEKPWVAAVDTFAIGGGMQITLVLDHVVAGSDSYFSLPAAQEGIVPGAGNLRLTRHTGARVARQIILSGRRIHATDPEAGLIIDEVTGPEEVGTAAERAAQQLAGTAVIANRRMLNLAEESMDAFRGYFAEFALAQGLRLYSADVLAKVGRSWSGPGQGADGDRDGNR